MATSTKYHGLLTYVDEGGNEFILLPATLTDTSLTKYGMAADAGTVGAALKETLSTVDTKLTAALNNIDNKVDSIDAKLFAMFMKVNEHTLELGGLTSMAKVTDHNLHVSSKVSSVSNNTLQF